MAPGILRLERYELLKSLAVGGMGEVFLARQRSGFASFERIVAVKVLLKNYSTDEEFVKMFQQEASLAVKLNHPNIVQVSDLGFEDGHYFIAREYVAGESLQNILKQTIKRNQRIPVRFAVEAFTTIADALDYAHGMGLIHRDVTPSNIMLTRTGGVKLLDFGVAKVATAAQLTKTGTVKGKPAYLAPEQLEGKKIDGRVDLFALGIVMHEALSLEHLFAGDSDLGTVKKIMEMEIVAPSRKCPDVPPELDAIVMRALERDRDRRYASAADMARELDDFLIASKFHTDDVGAFVREIEAEAPVKPAAGAPAAAEANAAPTRRDLSLAVRMWSKGRMFGKPRGAVVAGVALLALGLATAFGLKIGIGPKHNVAEAAEQAEQAAPPPAAAPVIDHPMR